MHRNTRTKRNKRTMAKSLECDSGVFATLTESIFDGKMPSPISPQLVVDVTGTFDASSPPAKHHRRNAMTSEEMHTILHDINYSSRRHCHSMKKEGKTLLRSRRCETWDHMKFMDMQLTLPNTTFPSLSVLEPSSRRRNLRCDAWDDVQFAQHFENENTGENNHPEFMA